MSSNRQFRQIRGFRHIRRFVDTPLFRSLPQNSKCRQIVSFAKFPYLFPFRQFDSDILSNFSIFVVACISGHISVSLWL